MRDNRRGQRSHQSGVQGSFPLNGANFSFSLRRSQLIEKKECGLRLRVLYVINYLTKQQLDGIIKYRVKKGPFLTYPRRELSANQNSTQPSRIAFHAVASFYF